MRNPCTKANFNPKWFLPLVHLSVSFPLPDKNDPNESGDPVEKVVQQFPSFIRTIQSKPHNKDGQEEDPSFSVPPLPNPGETEGKDMQYFPSAEL